MGRSSAYPTNPTHVKIAVTKQQYQNNLDGYHLVKSMEIYLKKIIIAAIYDQWIKGDKYIVMGYAKNLFVEFID